MSYREDVYEDLKEAVDEGEYDYLLERFSDDDGNVEWDNARLGEALMDAAFVDDGITGNASGSYYFNSYKAREMVLDHLDEVREAFEDLDAMDKLGGFFANEEWEAMDVWARCHFLYYAVDAVIADKTE